MYSDGIILLHGNFKHTDTHHEKLSSRPAKAAPRAWFEATRNPVLSNPGFEPASTSSNGVKLPKKMAAQQETASLLWRRVKHDGDRQPKFKVPVSL